MGSHRSMLPLVSISSITSSGASDVANTVCRLWRSFVEHREVLGPQSGHVPALGIADGDLQDDQVRAGAIDAGGGLRGRQAALSTTATRCRGHARRYGRLKRTAYCTR